MDKLNSNRQSHYGNSMNPKYMGEWGKEIGKAVDAIIDDGKFPILLYRGMSGTTTATTVSLNISRSDTEFAMVYVRKKGEKSHGSRIEYSRISTGNREPVWIICDDFISSGKTALEILKAVSKYFDMEIPLSSVRYALSLDSRYSDIANNVNTLKEAVSLRCNREEIMDKMKRNYSAFIRKERKARKEREERRAEATREFLESLTSPR